MKRIILKWAKIAPMNYQASLKLVVGCRGFIILFYFWVHLKFFIMQRFKNLDKISQYLKAGEWIKIKIKIFIVGLIKWTTPWICGRFIKYLLDTVFPCAETNLSLQGKRVINPILQIWKLTLWLIQGFTQDLTSATGPTAYRLQSFLLWPSLSSQKLPAPQHCLSGYDHYETGFYCCCQKLTFPGASRWCGV